MTTESVNIFIESGRVQFVPKDGPRYSMTPREVLDQYGTILEMPIHALAPSTRRRWNFYTQAVRIANQYYLEGDA